MSSKMHYDRMTSRLQYNKLQESQKSNESADETK